MGHKRLVHHDGDACRRRRFKEHVRLRRSPLHIIEKGYVYEADDIAVPVLHKVEAIAARKQGVDTLLVDDSALRRGGKGRIVLRRRVILRTGGKERRAQHTAEGKTPHTNKLFGSHFFLPIFRSYSLILIL